MSCVGQMICAVVAESRALAKRGARAVRVDYQDLPDPIFTLEVRGRVDAALRRATPSEDALEFKIKENVITNRYRFMYIEFLLQGT